MRSYQLGEVVSRELSGSFCGVVVPRGKLSRIMIDQGTLLLVYSVSIAVLSRALGNLEGANRK